MRINEKQTTKIFTVTGIIQKLVSVVFVCFMMGCSSTQNDLLEKALQQAGENRQELESVLEHYKNDSLKWEAARFLITNMPYHYAMEEYYISSKGESYRPDLSCFNEPEKVKQHVDSLQQVGYRMHSSKRKDLTSLEAAFLIKNIDLAFSAWEKPWSKEVPFAEFCRYILPYRAQIEEISLLREDMMDRFMPILDSANVTTPFDACMVLNKHLKGMMRYKNTGSPFYPTIEDTYYSGISQCEGLCNLGAFIMRAVGIPVTVEQATWTKMDLGHNWCVVWHEGRFYPFGPGEDQPDVWAEGLAKVRTRRPAKVYRSRFDPVFPVKKEKEDGYITHLKSPLKYDVTDEYLNKTVTIQFSVDKNRTAGNASELVYLCTYNFYNWIPIAIGNRKNNSDCIFEKVVGDNIFIIADSPDGRTLRFISPPFYVDEEGEIIQQFVPDLQNRQSFIMNKPIERKDKIHTLSYWDTREDRFIPLKYTEKTDTTQHYDQIPANSLLWFTIPDRILGQRTFFILNDSIHSY